MVTTVLSLMPSSVFSKPDVVKLVGTANPLVARIVCIVIAIFFWFFVFGMVATTVGGSR